MPKIFLSYSRVDLKFAEDLYDRIQRMRPNDSIWYDKAPHGLLGGDSWWNQILDAIADADIFIYLLSNESVQSKYCQAEFEEARRLQKQIITIQARDHTKLTDDLEGIQYVDMKNGVRDADAVVALSASLERQISLIKRQRALWQDPTPKPSEEKPIIRDESVPEVDTPPLKASFEQSSVEITLSGFQDKILLRAWRLMFQHDLKAVAARRNFRQTQFSLISISVLSTATVVLATFFDETLLSYKLLASIALGLVAGSAFINYIQKYEKITIWLKHRIVTERLRSEIYQYRMQVGDYYRLPRHSNVNEEIPRYNAMRPQSPEERLNDIIHQIEKELEAEETHFAVDRQGVDSKIVRQLRQENSYISEGRMNFEDYLKIRGINQKNWYEGTINKNSKKNQYYRSLALFVQMGGAVLTALVVVTGLDSQFIVFAAVTNVIGFGIHSWMTVETTGQFNSIFNVARKQLSKHLGDWDVFSDQSNMDESINTEERIMSKQQYIVEAIERTLSTEREDWYRLSLQTLSSNDQVLFQAVEDLQQDDNEPYSGAYEQPASE